MLILLINSLESILLSPVNVNKNLTSMLHHWMRIHSAVLGKQNVRLGSRCETVDMWFFLNQITRGLN